MPTWVVSRYNFLLYLTTWGSSAHGLLIRSPVSSIPGSVCCIVQLRPRPLASSARTSLLLGELLFWSPLKYSDFIHWYFKDDFTRQQIKFQQMTPLCQASELFSGQARINRWFTSGCLKGNSEINPWMNYLSWLFRVGGNTFRVPLEWNSS